MRKTVHSLKTPHGLKTPHRYPDDGESRLDILDDLSVQLYPTGRAWYRPENGVFDKFHEAINVSFVRLIEKTDLLLDSVFPDNDNFDKNDAALWEYRLGLITNENTSLELRKEAIKRKLGHPNNIKARQHPLFIENQLRLAGFDVYIHENKKPYKTPNEVAELEIIPTEHGGDSQHGEGLQSGGAGFQVIANSIKSVEFFSVGGDDKLWATFFIGGKNLGDIAEVPESRLKEFKELVLKLKPAHTVAFTLITYI